MKTTTKIEIAGIEIKIWVKAQASRFGTLYIGQNDSGEPRTCCSAYSTPEAAITAEIFSLRRLFE